MNNLKTIKNILKNFIPPQMRVNIRKAQKKIFGIENDFKGMENSDIFDKIYNEGIWGKNVDGRSTSGEGSHSPEVINPYIAEISNFLSQTKTNTVVDLGCGDFNVGRNFTSLTKNYIACDVSDVILKRNKTKYQSIKHLDFRLLDLSKDKLPKGDICFVRQVLQHLSNTHIKNFVEKINSDKPYKYLVVTEHLPHNDHFIANLDKGAGANTRLMIGSGVVLHQEPFNLDARNTTDLLEIFSEGGIIKTIIYELI